MRLLYICVVYIGLNLKYKFSGGSQGLYYHLTRCASLHSPALSSRLHPDRKPGGEGQRDSELQVQSREARPAVQMDQGCTRVWGVLLPDAEWVIQLSAGTLILLLPLALFSEAVLPACAVRHESWSSALPAPVGRDLSRHGWIQRGMQMIPTGLWMHLLADSPVSWLLLIHILNLDRTILIIRTWNCPRRARLHRPQRAAFAAAAVRSKRQIRKCSCVIPACVWFWRVIICSPGCSESTICFWNRLRLIDWISTDPLWSL